MPRAVSLRVLSIIAAASVVPAVLDAAQTYMKERLDGRPGIGWNAVVFQGAEWLFLGALTPITYAMARRFPLQHGRRAQTLAAHFAGALVLCVGWATLGIAAGRPLDAWIAQGDLGQAYFNWLLTTLPWSVIMYFTVLGCMYAFSYYEESREREAHAARLAAQLAESRLDALRMQLNPHFLFNSLNAVTVLVRDGEARAASRMLELLADILRHVLRTDQPHEVPLSDEIGFVEQYLAIEQVRFSDRLRVRWSVETGAQEALVPPFVLQTLVENAVRHGVARKAGAGRIDVTARVAGPLLRIVVSDDGAGIEGRVEAAGGVGLSNTRERLRTLYGEAARLVLERGQQGGADAVVTLPYRRRSG